MPLRPVAFKVESAVMPSVLREGPYRFFFYTADRVEPPHIHVERDSRVAKFWLNPVSIQDTGRMSSRELRRIERIILDNQDLIMEAWNTRFNR